MDEGVGEQGCAAQNSHDRLELAFVGRRFGYRQDKSLDYAVSKLDLHAYAGAHRADEALRYGVVESAVYRGVCGYLCYHLQKKGGA